MIPLICLDSTTIKSISKKTANATAKTLILDESFLALQIEKTCHTDLFEMFRENFHARNNFYPHLFVALCFVSFESLLFIVLFKLSIFPFFFLLFIMMFHQTVFFTRPLFLYCCKYWQFMRIWKFSVNSCTAQDYWLFNFLEHLVLSLQ